MKPIRRIESILNEGQGATDGVPHGGAIMSEKGDIESKCMRASS